MKNEFKLSERNEHVDFRGEFGLSLTRIPDLDGNGLDELAVGAPGNLKGMIWVFDIFPNRTFAKFEKIGPNENGFTGNVQDYDTFGSEIKFLPDIDSDGYPEVCIGAPVYLFAS